MGTREGWQPLEGPRPTKEQLVRSITETSPFTRLARTHGLMAAGDAAVAVALAGSLFFDIDPQSARWRVAAYLLFSLAPFAIVAPFVGPIVDRMPGGRRAVVVAMAAAKALVCAGMALYLDSLLLFPIAFAFLVLQKGYAVSRAALVPTVVSSEAELVEANAKLGLLAGIVGFAAAVPALLMKVAGAEAPLILAVLASVAAALVAVRLPPGVVAAAPPDELERAELHRPAVLLAASAMALLRATVGFLTFAIAFSFRRAGYGSVWFGVVAMVAVGSTMTGNGVAGMIRRHVREERMLIGALVLTAAGGFVTSFASTLWGAVLLSGVVGFSAAVGRLAFDAIVQRDAPDANRGRAFAVFETRFQLAWVVAAAIPVVLPLPSAVAYFVVGVIAAAAAFSYLVTARKLKAGEPLPDPLARRLWLQARQRARRGLGRPARLPPGSPLPPPVLPDDASETPDDPSAN